MRVRIVEFLLLYFPGFFEQQSEGQKMSVGKQLIKLAIVVIQKGLSLVSTRDVLLWNRKSVLKITELLIGSVNSLRIVSIELLDFLVTLRINVL
ncbi:hypothetical protein C444_07625 [Haloarcula japonica DSM 6131]|uniref:Uncharacterized protein n=1 Tax=Haloarcula japonica (strain ATCC 49778 / DSM 6131 / JCM 7785 / NBRC 101032 / NCIMB 13157 / TR-1) TaxID=1227453 RepID=M0LED1_HALJT|nr:hypothetical protein C444_07625 [Haloarcula japonica DSM 6131]